MYVCACVCVHVCVHARLRYPSLQHASVDVERILVGNKCDLESKRVIPRNKAEQVSSVSCDTTSYHDITVDGRIT